MAEILPSDIGLATFADVGDVTNLRTNAKEVVAAINEVLANSEGTISGEQLFMEGEDNTVIGGGNVILGNGNRVFGTGNLIVGDNHLVIGSNKTVSENLGDVTFDWVDVPYKKIYFYIYDDDTNLHLQAGDKVVIDIYQSWCDPDWEDWIDISTGKFLTTVTEINMDYSYILVADMPLSEITPPDDHHTILDYIYASSFFVLREEYKKNGNGSINMGRGSAGLSSISGNNANAIGNYSAGFNFSSAKGYSTFTANSGQADGNYAFAANSGYTNAEYSSALNRGYTYTGSSCALNYGRTCGRAIKCVSMNGSSGTITAAEGEALTDLVGSRLLVRYKNLYNSILYSIKTVSSVSGRTIYLDKGFGSSSYSLMPDGYVFRVESGYGTNFATGYGVTGNRYSQAHGSNTLGVHEGSFICGRYGVSPENYSWSLANGTSFSDMALAVKILQNGDIHADGTLSSPCADYSEMFEWQDGNPNNEDRAGYFVKLVGDKIAIADEFDTPLGIISAMPAIIGDSGEMHWQGKYVTDDFGRIKYHDVVIPEEKDDEGNIIVEERIERQPMLNPEWDSEKEYVPRLKRPEWATVGVLGKLIVYDEGTLQSGDLCRCGKDGNAIKSINNGYPVLKRIADDKVLIWFRG